MPKTFILYSHREREFVSRLYESMIEFNRDPWVDWKGIPTADDWLSHALAALAACDEVIFVVSPDSIRSGNCLQELNHARRLGKKVVPILRRKLEGPMFPPGLQSDRLVDFCGDENFEGSFRALLDALDATVVLPSGLQVDMTTCEGHIHA